MNELPVPVGLERDPRERALVIAWADGVTQRIPYRELRDRCPCAGCRGHGPPDEKPDNPLRVLSPAETQPLEIVSMTPAGSYAYHIRFSDGHSTGIFSFEFLRGLTESD